MCSLHKNSSVRKHHPQVTKKCGSSVKRRRARTRVVEFVPKVSLRCYFHNAQHYPTWMNNDELEAARNYAKWLSKLHRQATTMNGATEANSLTSARVGDATRYEIKGESLRGLEHITDAPNGIKRKQIKQDALFSTAFRSQERTIWRELGELDGDSDCTEMTVDRSKSKEVDTSEMAELYRAKTQGSLDYARRVAQEDAKVAAEILAEDLKPVFTSLPRCAPARRVSSLSEASL